MTYKMIQVGSGGFAKSWCRDFLPPNVDDGLIEVVAAVDINPEALRNAQEGLGLRPDQCYTDMQKAFRENKADFCTVVVPPAFHEQVVDLALEKDIHILSEKPIADTLTASVRIAHKVRQAGKKMGVTMSHRFRQDITTLRHELRSGRDGELDHLVCSNTCAQARVRPRVWRFDSPYSYMIDTVIHHLDLLADLGGAKCDTIYAQTWRPPWSEYVAHSQGLVIMLLENGKRVTYEAGHTNAVGLHCWGEEYIRAECDKSILIMDHGRLQRVKHNASAEGPSRTGYWEKSKNRQVDRQHGEEVPLMEQRKWANTWLIEKFVHWLDGGQPMETNVEDNLQSTAMIFGAIQSSQTGQPVKVQELLDRSHREAEAK
jgi:predicted dehydrogenase